MGISEKTAQIDSIKVILHPSHTNLPCKYTLNYYLLFALTKKASGFFLNQDLIIAASMIRHVLYWHDIYTLVDTQIHWQYYSFLQYFYSEMKLEVSLNIKIVIYIELLSFSLIINKILKSIIITYMIPS